jgi:hypothetical protein
LAADEIEVPSSETYEIMINNYNEMNDKIEDMGSVSLKQVVLYDSKGNITRQIDVKDDPEITTPRILKPLICNAEFLTTIDGVYYYICDKL